jgi:transketolase
MGHRSAFGDSMVLLGKENPIVVAVLADITNTARMVDFEKNFPQRLINVGIAEQNMIGMTTGLAKEGLIPFAITAAAFAPMRCAEQMRMGLGYMNLNAKVVGIEAGMRFGSLGNTHFAMDDIAVVRAMPNFAVICPSDPYQIYKAVFAAAAHPGPVYIRLTGAPGFPNLYLEDFDYEIGKAIDYKQGSAVAIISTGSMLGPAIQASKILEQNGISTRVIDMHTVKPLDKKMLDDVFANNELIVSVEEHSIIGGLGSAIAEYKSAFASAPKQIMCAIPDSFRKIGCYEFQLEQSELTPESIAAKAMENL